MKRSKRQRGTTGFTLLELVITLFVLSILTLGVMPLVQVAIKRQREQALREALREMRGAIDQFRRDVIGGPCAPPPAGVGQAANPEQPNQQNRPGQQQPSLDPRSRVMITDCTIFTVDNPDRYPPDLETLVNGVSVAPRAGAANQLGGAGLGSDPRNATDVSGTLSTKKKIYLREIPIDPMTGKREWNLRSLYDSPESSSWGSENVFDVRSKSSATALNGEKYSDW